LLTVTCFLIRTGLRRQGISYPLGRGREGGIRAPLPARPSCPPRGPYEPGDAHKGDSAIAQPETT